MREKAVDAFLGATIKTVEELEALVVMLENLALPSKLRELADLLDTAPKLLNDLAVIKRGLRAKLSTDPDQTPRAISVKDLVAVDPLMDTRFSTVEERQRRIESRTQTRPGLGIPLPKKE